jgi:hypothetical protein
MATPLIPQEIYLLEQFCSLERFGKMRDAWAEMLKHAEDCLQRFMRQLPPDYRSRPLPQQPDMVWGDRVLPNFRNTLRGLNDGYIRLSHGDLSALGYANGVTGDLRGQGMDYPEDWMDEVEPGAADKFSELVRVAHRFAKPIMHTSNNTWSEGSLTARYVAVFPKEPLNAPSTWPVYRLDTAVRVKSGERTPRTGIYLPDVDHGFPALLLKANGIAGEAREASVPTSIDASGYKLTVWTLVERVADSGGGIPGAEDAAAAAADQASSRCEAGNPCPREGWWVTLAASANNRRHFKTGELMPDLHNKDIATIWYWTERQGGDA